MNQNKVLGWRVKMKLSDLFDRDAYFRSEEEIKSYISNSKKYKQENPSDAKLLKIFSTSKQRTYLVITDKMIYCILDDARKNKPHLNWSKTRDNFFDGKNLTVAVTTREKSTTTGLVDFGSDHKNWLFTKSLFKDISIENKLKSLLSEDFD